MQIHELNSFIGTPSATDYLAIDDGTETNKIPATDLGVSTQMTQTEATAGTVTDPRVIAPKVLHDFAQSFVLDVFYPVGSYYETSDTSFDPNTAWGGTWVLETAGQVHVSAGTGYAVNGALTDSSDGGEATHLITAGESGQKALSISGGGHSHPVTFYYRNTVAYNSGESARPYSADGSSSTTNWASIASGTGTHTHSVSASNASTPISLMQPYIVVNRWHRTA